MSESKDPQSVISKHQQQCAASIAAFKRDLQKFRTGRASTGLLENVMADYYGAKTALSHLAQISTPEARVIMLQVYDSAAVSAVEKGIQTSGLGLNPSRDGNSIRVILPPLTEETRRDLVKQLQKLAEEMKVSMRNHRRDANDTFKKLEKDGDISKDDSKKFADKVQQQTDSAIAEIDKILVVKEAEVTEV